MFDKIKKKGKVWYMNITVTRMILLGLTIGLVTQSSAIRAPNIRPTMGWNSYDCFSYAVTEDTVRNVAKLMADSLKQYGWEYVCVDYIWWIPRVGPGINPQQDADFKPKGAMDAYGRLLPDTTRFPSAKGGAGFKPLADYVHSLGLKFGLHAMRGIPRQAVAAKSPILGSATNATCDQAADMSSSCPWLNHMWGGLDNQACKDYYVSILQLYADWGVDLLKLDDLTYPYSVHEVANYGAAFAACDREIVFSTSPGETPVAQWNHISQWANMWRTLPDLWDNWPELDHAFDVAAAWAETGIMGPGKWPDLDMLPWGHIALYGPIGQPRWSDLTHDQIYAMMGLWCIVRNPLIYGGSLTDNINGSNDIEGKFNMSVLTNKDAIRVNQRSIYNKNITTDVRYPVWCAADSADTSIKYLGVFNRTLSPATVTVVLGSVGVTNFVEKKNIWTGETTPGSAEPTLAVTVPAHGCAFYILNPKEISVIPRTIVRQAPISTRNSILTLGGAFVLPSTYIGKTVALNVYDLAGKHLTRFILKNVVNRTVDIRNVIDAAKGVYLVVPERLPQQH
ncbi:MAG: glycoside hydrolase family 27 protein [Chitinispirillaceae bacterium]|nr:glycoside hydrolase family 27 protein [Chitinispirillaceae bacterium]